MRTFKPLKFRYDPTGSHRPKAVCHAEEVSDSGWFVSCRSVIKRLLHTNQITSDLRGELLKQATFVDQIMLLKASNRSFQTPS